MKYKSNNEEKYKYTTKYQIKSGYFTNENANEYSPIAFWMSTVIVFTSHSNMFQIHVDKWSTLHFDWMIAPYWNDIKSVAFFIIEI